MFLNILLPVTNNGNYNIYLFVVLSLTFNERARKTDTYYIFICCISLLVTGNIYVKTLKDKTIYLSINACRNYLQSS